MARWYTGAVICRFVNGKIEFLVHDTKSTDPKFAQMRKQTKFIGGTEKVPDKNVIDTLRREIEEETDLILPLDAKPLMIHHVPGREHFKNFYLILIEELEGQMREVEKTMEGDWMSAPYWVDYEMACRTIYTTHQPALLKVNERPRKVPA